MSRNGSENFYFYDYETFGQHPAFDRPAQFAGIRTDANFNPIGEPTILYCQPPEDYLPDPHAVLITGITPQQALREGVTEVAFARRIQGELSQPNSCILGYNNIRFDDEVTRYLFYRNFYDPYEYSWRQGNSRWDLLDVVRACYALRPLGIEWPHNDQGEPSFQLQHLSHVNGIAHHHVHDALSDVYATIGLAKRLKHAQPRLFDYLWQHRTKHRLAALIDTVRLKPLLHVSGMFGNWRGNISWVVPLAWHPENQNAVIVCDLAGDIEPLLTQDSRALRQRLYTKRDALKPSEKPIPLKLIHLNKCPVLVPANALSPEGIERLQLNRTHCLNNVRALQAASQVREKVSAIFDPKLWQEAPNSSNPDVETRLYERFFNAADRMIMQQLHHTPPEQLAGLADRFQDERLAPLLFRFRARNFPSLLDQPEQLAWKRHCQQSLASKKNKYLQQLALLMQKHAHHPAKSGLLQALIAHAERLASEERS